MATLGTDAYPVALGDTQLLGQCSADFDEFLRLSDGIESIVHRPVMEMLGQAIAGRGMRELVEGAEILPILCKYPCARVVLGQRIIGMQGIGVDRCFERFVVLREGPFVHAVTGEQLAAPGLVHDERTLTGIGSRGHREVGYVIADPTFTVPPYNCLACRPGRAIGTGTGAIVENATVGRPRPGPAQCLAGTVGVGVVTPHHLVATIGPATGKDPAAAGGRAVGAQQAEVLYLLPGTYDQVAVLVVDILQRPTVVFAGEFFRAWVLGITVGPVQVEDGLVESPSLFLIEPLHAQEDTGHDRGVGLGFARGRSGLPEPL